MSPSKNCFLCQSSLLELEDMWKTKIQNRWLHKEHNNYLHDIPCIHLRTRHSHRELPQGNSKRAWCFFSEPENFKTSHSLLKAGDSCWRQWLRSNHLAAAQGICSYKEKLLNSHGLKQTTNKAIQWFNNNVINWQSVNYTFRLSIRDTTQTTMLDISKVLMNTYKFLSTLEQVPEVTAPLSSQLHTNPILLHSSRNADSPTHTHILLETWVLLLCVYPYWPLQAPCGQKSTLQVHIRRTVLFASCPLSAFAGLLQWKGCSVRSRQKLSFQWVTCDSIRISFDYCSVPTSSLSPPVTNLHASPKLLCKLTHPFI